LGLEKQPRGPDGKFLPPGAGSSYVSPGKAAEASMAAELRAQGHQVVEQVRIYDPATGNYAIVDAVTHDGTKITGVYDAKTGSSPLTRDQKRINELLANGEPVRIDHTGNAAKLPAGAHGTSAIQGVDGIKEKRYPSSANIPKGC
jgi:hypothetical protein